MPFTNWPANPYPNNWKLASKALPEHAYTYEQAQSRYYMPWTGEAMEGYAMAGSDCLDDILRMMDFRMVWNGGELWVSWVSGHEIWATKAYNSTPARYWMRLNDQQARTLLGADPILRKQL